MLDRIRRAVHRLIAEENVCPICDRAFESPEVLDRHVATEHRLAPPITDGYGTGL